MMISTTISSRMRATRKKRKTDCDNLVNESEKILRGTGKSVSRSIFYAVGKFVDKFVFFISWKKKKIPVYYKDMN